MIERIELKNFTVFDHLEIKFSPKVNIIIGENGAGKTHLIKAAYALQSASSEHNILEKNKKKLPEVISQKLVNLFRPHEMKLGKLRRRGVAENAEMQIDFSSDRKLVLNFHTNSKKITFKTSGQSPNDPIFIPTKEIFSFLQGISDSKSDKETVKRIFDGSYLDLHKAIMSSVEQDVDNRLNNDPRFGTIYPKLVDAVDGRYELSDGNFLFHSGCYTEIEKRFDAKHSSLYSDTTKYVFKRNKEEAFSTNMTAEGFRKIGILQQLLANERLEASRCGTLYWDEPESNLNPNLARLIVETILELSRNGLQIILATHDYVFLKWFDLLVDKGKEDHVRFHVLQRNNSEEAVVVESTDEYSNLAPNAIFETFSNLTDQEITKTMGGLGK